MALANDFALWYHWKTNSILTLLIAISCTWIYTMDFKSSPVGSFFRDKINNRELVVEKTAAYLQEYCKLAYRSIFFFSLKDQKLQEPV